MRMIIINTNEPFAGANGQDHTNHRRLSGAGKGNMTKHAAARTRTALRAASTAGLSVSAFFLAAPVLGLLAPQASFAAAIAAFAAATGLDAIRDRTHGE